MKFEQLAHSFNQLEATASRTEMTKILAELLQQASPIEAAIICNMSLGQLNPPYIGTQFNIATALMMRVVAKLLEEPESIVKSRAQELGDLGSVVEADYAHTPSQKLSIEQVCDRLHQLEALSGPGSQEEKTTFLYTLLNDLDQLSAKYVIRIILGKLRLGFSDMTIIDALSWMEAGDKSHKTVVEDAYNVCADIGLIARMLKEHGIKAVATMHITLGIPIRPAAAERLPTAHAIVEKLGHCVAQPKLDGFRLQIHLDKRHKNPVVHFFSRNLQDMSAMFPDLVQAVCALPVTELICEGEAIVYDPATGSFVPFQETAKRKRKHGIEEMMHDYPLQVFIFDLLYVDGQEYLTTTHAQRRAKLLAIFKGYKNQAIHVIEEKKITTTKELEDYFTANIAAGLEGLVVKRDDSLYQPGKRNFNWIKLKRQEEGHLEDTIDCVVLGYYAGQGKRASFGIGAFLVGVYNPDKDRFETIAKIGTGLKDVDWIELKKKCDALAITDKAKNLVCAKELYPDVWVSPEIVVIVRADEITLSPVHSAGKTDEHLGYALRFPRFMGYSLQKSAAETTTVAEVQHLYEDQFVNPAPR